MSDWGASSREWIDAAMTLLIARLGLALNGFFEPDLLTLQGRFFVDRRVLPHSNNFLCL